ncbi:gamma-glutamylcyclotransferase family protein [Aestuariivivens sediminis]|uniref:gamma-glutamylcyclotransferase family protein n=1 Tax=Aestuariivivens sediminis TaxID=2913557 RepID=UPI001F583A49|nr:gamma-glutamylcyclotransferase family protein [Aestuariivivens sediminis]
MHSTNYLFVYGTLLSDVNNAMSKFLETHSEYVGKGYFPGKLYMVDWYPGAIAIKQGKNKVFGRIYRMSNAQKVLEVLDGYEGIDEGLYKRHIMEVFLESKTVYNCWVYLYNQPITDLEQIQSGDFLNP